ncbi:glucose repression mediator protein [Marasmius tenuissimus]|nr:glucose repression mediator protein [Marasmius tenuissimus]
MSIRHPPRLPDRDIRMHDPPPPPPHPSALIPQQPPAATPIVSPTVSAAPNGALPPPPPSMIQKLNTANEQTWLLIGRVAEQMGDLEHALSAYENALRHNPMSLSGLTQVAGIARIKENYPKAIEFFQRVLSLQEENGEVWSALGHCYLMQDDLQKAYSAYQQALYLLPNPREDPKLWYGIGILYDRYGSLDHAEEAFSSVLRMDKDFDKANEILFRLGIIYKQQGKYDESLGCFDRILRNPPSPLANADIWFQIGHVYEQQKDHDRAKNAYERVVADNPGHAKVLQQLGWLYHQDGSSFQNQDLAIQYLTKSLEADSSDAQSWYLLGRAYMAGQKYNKAYEAYQQAVYRDGRNPTFWCSIGVLYFQINQFRDALDAYSRAIRINPYISEVWFDLGSLYESCNNQISDAIDAYARASELDPGNEVISGRLILLKQAQTTGGQLPAAPGPQDVHPTAYASAVVPPPGLSGPPLLLQTPGQRGGIPSFRTDSRGPPGNTNEISLPPPSANQPLLNGHTRSPPGPFRGGPPPPVNIDEGRHVQTLAPMDVDSRPPLPRHGHSREYSQDRDGRDLRDIRDLRDARDARDVRDGGLPPRSLLLHTHTPTDERGPPPPPGRGVVSHPDAFFTRRRPSPARSVSPPPTSTLPPAHHSQPHHLSHSLPPHLPPHSSHHSRGRSPPPPPPPFQTGGFPPSSRANANPSPLLARSPSLHPRTSSASYPEPPPPPGASRIPPSEDGPWRPPTSSSDRERERDRDRDWERGRRANGNPEYPGGAGWSPAVSHREDTLPSPRRERERIWETQSGGAPPLPPVAHQKRGGSPDGPPVRERERGRYDPTRHDSHHMMRGDFEMERRDRAERERERERDVRDAREQAQYPPGISRMVAPPPPPPGHHSSHPSPHPSHPHAHGSPPHSHPSQIPTPTGFSRRTSESPHPISESNMSKRRRPQVNPPPPSDTSVPQLPSQEKKERKKRSGGKRRDEDGESVTSTPASSSLRAVYKASSPSASGSGSSRPSPTATGGRGTPRPPNRQVDDDYDEGVADTLMSLAAGNGSGNTSSGSANGAGSPPRLPHRDSVSSTRSLSGGNGSVTMASPSSITPSLPMPMKRPLSPGLMDDAPTPGSDSNKRSRIEIPGTSQKRRGSSPGSSGRRSPTAMSQSTRPSPIPFRQQPTSRSPEYNSNRDREGGRPPSGRGASPPGPGVPVSVLPPHPRPVGLNSGPNSATSNDSDRDREREREGGRRTFALPPIATLPEDPDDRERDRDAMQVDSRPSVSPPRSKHIAESPKHSPRDKGMKDA